MQAKKLAAMLTAALIFFSAATPAFAEDNFIRRTGSMTLSKEKATSSFYKSFARQVAKFDALRQLAECTPSFNLQSELIVTKEGLIAKDTVIVKIDDEDINLAKYLKQARQVGEAEFIKNDDGSLTCEVVMEMPQ